MSIETSNTPPSTSSSHHHHHYLHRPSSSSNHIRATAFPVNNIPVTTTTKSSKSSGNISSTTPTKAVSPTGVGGGGGIKDHLSSRSVGYETASSSGQQHHVTSPTKLVEEFKAVKNNPSSINSQPKVVNWIYLNREVRSLH